MYIAFNGYLYVTVYQNINYKFKAERGRMTSRQIYKIQNNVINMTWTEEASDVKGKFFFILRNL